MRPGASAGPRAWLQRDKSAVAPQPAASTVHGWGCCVACHRAIQGLDAFRTPSVLGQCTASSGGPRTSCQTEAGQLRRGGGGA